MTPAEMLADIRTVYRVAAEADVDHRTVIAALQGRRGKGRAYRRAMEAIAAWPMPVGPCPACAAKDEELASLRAKLDGAAKALMGKDGEVAAVELQLEQARRHLVEQMRDWKRQWSQAIGERDAARARIAELEAPTVAAVTALEARIATEDRKAEPVARPAPEPRSPDLIGQIKSRRGKMGGAPCIAGTRITVETFQALARDGQSDHGILALYPHLDIADVRAALAYQEPPRPAPRPREKCHVTLELDGRDLLAGEVAG